MPTTSRPRTSPLTSSTARRTAWTDASAARACSRAAVPAAVSVAVRAERSMSGAPRSRCSARANAGDAAGIAALYEEHAVMAYPPGGQTIGRDAIRALWEQVLENAPHFEPEPPLPTLRSGDIALTTTVAKDGAGGRAQVARRQPDGTWLRLLDQPELVPPVG